MPPHTETGYQSIPNYVTSVIENKPSGLIGPLEVSKILNNHADNALKLLQNINSNNNKELLNTLNDIQSMAYLGKYYAFKISGATNLALYRKTKEKSAQDEAVKQLSSALEYWKKYTESAMLQYKNPLWTNRVGIVDWVELTKEVRKDIEMALE